MVPTESCHGCSQAHDCQKIYEQLGHTGGPSITGKVFIAFALPMILFVATLAGFGRLLRGRLDVSWQTPVAFVLAVSTTVGLMRLVSLTIKRSDKQS
jgi:hypothetical protein